MQNFAQDLRYGMRMLMKKPGFTIIAAVTLMIGIGANTAIFSVINAVMLKPLPFPSPERLIAIRTTQTNNRTQFGVSSYPDFADWQVQQTAFEKMAAYYTRSFTLQTDSGAARLNGAVITAEMIPLLGINPQMGRTFSPAEDKAGGGRVVLISNSLWQNRFNADQQIIGKALSINGESFVIAGVMPPGFNFPIQTEPIELWTNMARDAEVPAPEPLTTQRGNHYLNVIGRLKPEASLHQAETQLVAIAAALEKQFPNENTNLSVSLLPVLEDLTGNVSNSLLVLFAAVGFVLLIACANVANLLLVRAAGRRKEIALRASLGASRWRVIRQLLTESLLLALLGGGGGILLASFGTDALITLSPISIPRLTESALDNRVLLFTLFTSVLTGLVMGLIPAWQASRLDLQSVLKEGGHGTIEEVTRFSTRSLLIISEIALAVILLIGAGLLIQSFAGLLRVNPGFNSEHLLSLRIGLPDGLYTKPQQITEFHERLMMELETLPGVKSFSTVAPTPLSGNNIRVGFNVAGRPNSSGRQYPYDTRLMLVGTGYFSTMGISVREGREYSAHDNLQSLPVVIINEAFARRHFPNENPLGKRIDPSISAGNGDPPMREIIGIVADSRSRQLSAEPEPEVYLHVAQVPSPGSMTLLLRTQAEPQSLLAAARQKILSVDSNVPIFDVKAFNEYLSNSVAQPRFNSLLLGVFAGIALLLTAIGLFGVVAHSVSQRTREIGIRIALGAQPRDVLWLVIGQGMYLVLIGITIGLAGAFALTRLLKSLLFGVSTTDPITFVMIPLLLLIVTLFACYVPAKRATRVDPMTALRCE